MPDGLTSYRDGEGPAMTAQLHQVDGRPWSWLQISPEHDEALRRMGRRLAEMAARQGVTVKSIEPNWEPHRMSRAERRAFERAVAKVREGMAEGGP